MQVVDLIDCHLAQKTARKLVKSLGFREAEGEEIVIATSELASNLIRHAGSGSLTFKPLQIDGQAGLEIESQDQGPGIIDVDQSMTDGYSTAGGLGLGLGTVNRLMDELEINSTPERGTRIACRRWVRPPIKERTFKWDVGAATYSRRFAPCNGDAFVIKEWGSSLLVGLIDGLGHGQAAQEAALTAQRYVLAHYDRPLDMIFAGTARACRSTRGVVMALARFESPTFLKFASIGNVEVRALCGEKKTNFLAQRGILGADQLKATVHEFQWDPNWLLILHSDGLRGPWQWEDFAGLDRDPAQAIAQRFLRKLATHDDDATIVAVRS